MNLGSRGPTNLVERVRDIRQLEIELDIARREKEWLVHEQRFLFNMNNNPPPVKVKNETKGMIKGMVVEI